MAKQRLHYFAEYFQCHLPYSFCIDIVHFVKLCFNVTETPRETNLCLTISPFMGEWPMSLHRQNLVQLHCEQQSSAGAGLLMLTESGGKMDKEYFSLHFNLLSYCRFEKD